MSPKTGTIWTNAPGAGKFTCTTKNKGRHIPLCHTPGPTCARHLLHIERTPITFRVAKSHYGKAIYVSIVFVQLSIPRIRCLPKLGLFCRNIINIPTNVIYNEPMSHFDWPWNSMFWGFAIKSLCAGFEINATVRDLQFFLPGIQTYILVITGSRKINRILPANGMTSNGLAVSPHYPSFLKAY